ncbi:hypothetical protein CONPUDRAFT_58514 [Coniophora puteana RWD-64-598 SS2]|uniref:Xylanolytic transcriptional activator regulatory domain-containing protein n=1 Tax=Coniophora puteana (strain RWD-64-598) TaxID=741705 RepID=A0A5M3MMB7_CONPW|nr:uncharacterized protein CONPUDRAFT_58514 [Coniophora puteana RWD-64-598 SS2]EIW79721.1 hypothetical protein CONPUDRAFT_58514 [Coniophora puteana RWD-64-598 SS2]
MSVYYSSHSPSFADHPTVTPSLVAHIPLSLRRRQKMYESLEELLKMHPCFNWKHFKDRSESMFKWASESDDVGGASFGEGRSGSVATTPTTKADLARAIFFGTSSGPCAQRAPAAQRPPISFFAAASAAFALGGLLDKSADEQAESLRSDPVRNGKIISKDTASAPAVLFALSQQALTVFENSNTYDLDYLVAMILQVLYVLHEGKARLAHNLLPDVGKMVNVARTMGLDSDPDDFPGKFTLFEAELRRRVWWDIYYYDLFISDYMGRAPLINDHECSTRLPMDVDEELFNPSCGALPLPRTSQSALEPNASDFKYFRLKCRYVF